MARRVAQGIGLWVAMLAIVAMILVAANFGAGETCDVRPSPSAIGCFLRNYKELASGLLGATGAIFAAWIAWLAVQRQILSEELRATAKEREALAVLRAILTKDYLQVLDQIWRAMDLTDEKIGDEEKIKRRESVALQTLNARPLSENLNTLEQLASAIGTDLRIKFNPVLDGLRLLQKQVKTGPQDTNWMASYFFQLRFILSRLATCLHEFDPALARIFDNRRKIDPDIPPEAEALKAMIDASERGELD